MGSFTPEQVFEASFNFYPNINLNFFTNILTARFHLKREWDVFISKSSYPSLYQNVTDEMFIFIYVRENCEEQNEPMHTETGLYPSIVNIVLAMNDKDEKRIGAQKYVYNGIHKSVFNITQKKPFTYLRINQCL